MEKFRGWNSIDWESLPKTRKGHDEIVARLKTIFKSKYNLKIETFNRKCRKEARIAEKHSLRKPHYYVAHVPDILITNGNKPEDRIFIEYVNTEGKNSQNFLKDFRGMLALSRVMNAQGFVLAIRHSIFKKYAFVNISRSKYSKVEIMSLKSLFFALDRGDLDYLVGKNSSFVAFASDD